MYTEFLLFIFRHASPNPDSKQLPHIFVLVKLYYQSRKRCTLENVMKRIEKFGLQVDETLVDFIEGRALPGTDISQGQFWKGLSELVHEKGPKNRALLEERSDMQAKIDAWHIVHKAEEFDFAEYF